MLTISIGKGCIFALLARIFRYGNVIPLAVGLGLFQIGEFSFVLARVGVSTHSIGSDVYSLVLTAAVLTMIMTPLVSGRTARLYSLKKRWFRHEPLESMNLPKTGLLNHVIIAGGGRVGFQIAQSLKRLGLKFVIIDLNQSRVEHAKTAGMPVIYGDAAHEIVLEAARIGSASMLLITTPGIVVARAIAIHAKAFNSRIDIVARVSGLEFIEVFRELHVLEVVLPEFEAGLEMTRKALANLGIPAPEIQGCIERLRQELLSPDSCDLYQAAA